MRPTVSVTKTSNSRKLQDRLKEVSNQAVYVGIPSTTVADRRVSLITKASKIDYKSPNASRRQLKLLTAAAEEVNNAELLYLFSKGSPLNHQPPRPVIEPAIAAPGNKEAIAYELSQATKAVLDGKPAEAKKRLKRAGLAGQNASRKWFTDPRNQWAPNSPKTIALKGSDKPGIDTGVMRAAIIYVVKENSND